MTPTDGVLAVLPDAGTRLLQRARAGDVEAIMEAVSAHDRQLRALAYRLLGDRDAMDDALQDAYVSAYRALPLFEGRSAFGTWLHRIVCRTCLDAIRRRAREAHLPLDEVAELASPEDTFGGRVVRRSDLAGALAELPTDLAAAVLLVDAHGFSYEEAASVLDVPAGTIASRLSRARGALRPRLADHQDAR